MDGVTTGNVGPVFRVIAAISRVGGGTLDPAAGDLKVSAGWGYGGQDDVVMPGAGDVRKREYAPEELEAIEGQAASDGISASDLKRLLGQATYDVYLNGAAFWRNVPASVWEYRIGGYQVLKKWLSYREEGVLGRSISVEEARHFRDTARRIAAILSLTQALDENYQRSKTDSYSWSTL